MDKNGIVSFASWLFLGRSRLKELSMGFGYRKGPVIWDFGFAFRNGTWLHTMKGFNLSTGITLTSFGAGKQVLRKIVIIKD